MNAAARVPDHRLRLPAQRSRAGAAHEPAVHLRLPFAPRSRCSSARNTGRRRPRRKSPSGFIDSFIGDPSLCRLYLGLSKLDRETAEALKTAIAFPRLKVFAHVLDFFGGMFEIRGGKAMIPGGQRSAAAWAELTGASPDKGAEFFEKLMVKDDGWLASLYDALARIHGPVQDYLTDPARMKRFYTAVRGRITTPGPARPVFRSNTDMMLLTTRLRIDADGKAHIPGNLEVWKNLFVNHPQGKYDGKLTRLATTWKDPDDVLEALFALCRKAVENEPLKIFMAITRSRQEPREAAFARDGRPPGAQLSQLRRPVRRSSPNRGSLSDKSIGEFLDTAEAITKIRDPLFRSDVAGSFQALVSLWQIFVRQGTIPAAQADATFSALITQLRPGQERARTVRCRPQRREDAAWPRRPPRPAPPPRSRRRI